MEGKHEDILKAITESFKRATAITSTPSQGAKSSEYVENQSGEQGMLDWGGPMGNPLDTVAPPIQLFNPAFAYFSSKAFDPEYSIPRDIVLNVHNLMCQFAGIYPNEDARRYHITPSLQKAINHPLTFVCNSDGTTPDVLALSSCGALAVYLAVVKGKNEFRPGMSDPSVQAALSFQRILSRKENNELCLRCCCPAFIIAHAGPWLTIMGGIIVNLSKGRSAHSAAAQEAKTIEDSPKDILIKFVTSYGADAHQKMASTGFAPQLLYYGPINVTPDMPSYGDLRMVVMEYVKGLTLEDALKQGKVSPDFKADLRRAFEQLHTAGYVFGNLQQRNVMVTREGTSTAQLINFDWAGKEGEVKYPLLISRSVDWPEGVRGLEYIREEHDLAMLDSLMQHCPQC
ncbi:hypothetical protein OG21DRAFT_1496013 [Imleria badia]|nr:hypothetical protein OG21DRAFT_1496013 [Imleria badia]